MQAKSVKGIDRVLVSTDSIEIAAIAREYGAEVPFMRPEELATDSSPEWLSWQHGLDFLNKNEGVLPKVMLSIPTTSPLRLYSDIEKCLDLYLKGGADIVISTTDAHRNPYFNMVVSNTDGTVRLVCANESPVFQRQSAPTVYDVTTVCYVANPNFVLNNSSIFDGRVKAISIPSERAIDIDSLLDFQIAEYLLSKKENAS